MRSAGCFLLMASREEQIFLEAPPGSPLCPCTYVLLSLAEFSGVLHQCHILASEMVHFIHQMQYYITFEVPRAPWLGRVLHGRTYTEPHTVLSRFSSARGMSSGTECSRPRTWTTSSQRTRRSWTQSPHAVCWTATPG